MKRDTHSTSGPAAGLPLAGVRVLELCQIAAGPFTGSLLADLGADVVKIENPDGGDGMRQWPPLAKGENGETYSENFASLNRNKRSVTVGLKDPAGVAKLKSLVSQADVLVENFRTGTLPRLGLGYEQLKQVNPRLIYCSITGYGQNGPYAERGAFDVTVQGISGLMSVTGEEGRPPVKCGVPVADFCAGLYAAYIIAAAILRMRQTGEGAYIDCSMLGSLLGIAALQTSEYFGTGVPGVKLGSAHPRNAPYQAYKASDDYFIIAAGNDVLWFQVADAVGMRDLVFDGRFKTQIDRARNQSELRQILQTAFVTRTAKEWLGEMDKRGVPCAPIYNYADVFQDAHTQAMDLVKPIHLPNGVETHTVRFPMDVSGCDFGIYRDPPKLGAHTEEVLKEWLDDSSSPTAKKAADSSTR